MDIYHGFFDLKSGQSDVEFADEFAVFMDYLKREEKIVSWRLMRRKLGLGPDGLGEFHIMIEVENLAQLDAAFGMVSERSGDVEKKHAAVNQQVAGIKFALYRDFPDPHRKRGDEQF